jgi:hypothetical protein
VNEPVNFQLHQLMKRNSLITVVLAGAALAAVNANAGDPITNRLSLSLRVPFNIKAKFTGAMTVGAGGSTRTTPNGATYNYDDGYVFNDVSGSGDGLTWYWGYDDSASQVDSANNAILLSRTTGDASLSSPDMDDDGSIGFELAYAKELGRGESTRYGFEAALNFMSLGMSSGGSYRATGTRTVDSYAFTPGTTPPGASAGSEYQGTFDGPGFVIASTAFSSTTVAGGPIGTVSGLRSLDADVWGGRIGPYLEWDLDDNVSVSVSGGLALGLVDVSARWDESLTLDGGGTFTDAGSGSDDALQFGFYLAANLNWRLSDHWSAVGGVQYQNLGTYDESFGTRGVELDLSKSLFFTIGVGYSF